MWSGPRSMSTTLLYSFANRPDVTGVDEPLYAHHLSCNPHLTRPYKAELMAAQSPVGTNVIKEVLLGPCETPIIFCKHMAKQAIGTGLDMSWVTGARTKHIILIRDPVKLISSWAAKKASVGLEMTLEETGIAQLLALRSLLRAHGVREDDVTIVDADDVALNPVGVLAVVCARCGIRFLPDDMLTWPAGPKPYDGVWASYWYDQVHKSTGFLSAGKMSKLPYRRFPSECYGLLEDALPFYNALKRSTIVLADSILSVPVADVGGRRRSSDGGSSSSNSSSNTMLARGSREALAMTPDPKNVSPGLLVWVGPPGNGRLLPRFMAGCSVFDSAVQGGDAVW